MIADPRRTVRCARCNKDFPFDQVRYLPDGKRMGCVTCLGAVQHEEKVQREREGTMHDYQCLQCRYQFARNALRAPRCCPSCASPKLVRFEKSKLTSSQLLRIADDPRLERMDMSVKR